MELASGSMINNAVRLLEPLGQGGMGSVWLAEQLPSRTRVAVKLISTEASHNPEYRARFKREASIGAQITNQHSVQMLDCGLTDSGTPYIVMELLEGTDLTHAVSIKGPMSLSAVSQLVGQVAQVLELAHGMGIVHRDIKPDNIFLLDTDLAHESRYEVFAKVLDFGVAKLRANSGPDAPGVTKTGAVMGSPQFMSPEQAISSKNIDYRSDLYSLGIAAYYGLTGELPFVPGEQPLWVQLTSGDHIPPSAYVASLPPEVDAWFARALAPRPEGRFQSAREQAESLEAIMTRPSWDSLGHYGAFVTDQRPSWTGPPPLQEWAGQQQAVDDPYEDSCDGEDTAIMSYVDHWAAHEADKSGPGGAHAPPEGAAPSPPPVAVLPSPPPVAVLPLPPQAHEQPWQASGALSKMGIKRRRSKLWWALLATCLVTAAVVAVVVLLFRS